MSLPSRVSGRAITTLLAACAGVAATCALEQSAFAKETIVDAAPMEGKKIRIDGMLREWPATVSLSEVVAGSASGAPKAEAVAAYDDQHLYVAMSVADPKLVRTRSFGTNEDHGVLVIAFPSSSGYESYDVRLYPGEPGKSAGSVKVDGVGTVPGAQIVEAPTDGGLSFEAKIPWSVFPEAKKVRSGLRGALRYVNVDPGGKKTIVGTSKASGSNLPPLTIEAEYGLHQALIRPKGLNAKPDKQLVGNLVGDSMKETVFLFERYMAVTGWNYRGGSEFYYQDLKVDGLSKIERFSLQDVDGDGHDDLVIRRRVGSSGDAKDYFEVWHFRASNDGPQLLFQHEVGMVKGDVEIRNDADLTQKKGKWSVVVSQGDANGIDPESWDGPTISGDRATLMPWETVKSRRYEWRGQAFEMVEEEEWEPKTKAPKGLRTSSSPGSSEDPLGPIERERQPDPPRPPNAEELLDKVYALYRTDRGVKKGKPAFDFVTDVAGDETNERVLVHDKDIVVFGKKFKEGASYVYTTIGVKDAKDVLDVSARDITGDGRAEIIVRGIIPVQASKQLGGDVVTRHALMVYRVTENGVSRVFAAETGRSLEDKSILGRISFIPSDSGDGANAMRIRLNPGFAVGWTKNSYPFPQDPLPYGGLEPLLLPWTDMSTRAYVFDGDEFKLVQ